MAKKVNTAKYGTEFAQETMELEQEFHTQLERVNVIREEMEESFKSTWDFVRSAKFLGTKGWIDIQDHGRWLDHKTYKAALAEYSALTTNEQRLVYVMRLSQQSRNDV